MGAEAVEFGLDVGSGQLQHFEAVDAVGDVGVERGVGGGDDDIPRVVQLVVGVVQGVQFGLVGDGDVDDAQALVLGRDVGVGAR